ncbi:MFS transporter [Sphingobium sp. HWE2-09]|uniref:MFS transporter n=1 Tax=Sphingobium sp. HWE2-09 TaxID=3108390 RepID=UPI002DC35731|nr:MFS transporter [Sphingobium sp. HWE2-09]
MSGAAAIVEGIEPVEKGENALGLGGQLAYGAGQVAGQVFRDLPSLLLLFFMTTVLGIEPAVAGAAIFVPKMVFGIGSDIAVGVLSDRWQRRVHRRWWLLAGACGAPVAMLLLFHVPEGSTTLRIAYVAAMFSLYMIVFASFSVPYLALAGELTASPRQRNVIMAWRLVFTALGVMVSGGLAPALVQHWGGGQAAYELMAMVLAVICPVALLCAFFGASRVAQIQRNAPPSAPRVRLTMREAVAVLAHRRFSILLSANLLQLIGQGMSYASMLYFLSYNMARTDALTLIGLLVLTACAGIIVAQPIWVAAAARFGKQRCYVVAALIHGAFFALWGFGAQWGATAALFFSFAAAVGNSGWAMLGFSMVADISADDDRHAGLYSAVWIAADKIAFALGGTLLTGLLLSGFGFDAGRAVMGLPQSAGALTGVMFAFGIIPALLNLCGAIIMGRSRMARSA